MDLLEMEIIGMFLESARNIANQKGKSIRVIKINENYVVVTRDFVRTRLNVELKDGVIVKTFGYH